MGDSRRRQARAVFDWSAIVPQYQALWADQDARRRAAAPGPFDPDNPFRPDPYTLFAGYPTRHLQLDDRLTLQPGFDWPAAKAMLARPIAMYSGLHRPSDAETEAIVTWLADRPAARLR